MTPFFLETSPNEGGLGLGLTPSDTSCLDLFLRVLVQCFQGTHSMLGSLLGAELEKDSHCHCLRGAPGPTEAQPLTHT